MKKKIFQYGLVYWLAILINGIISFFYLAYSYSILISPEIDPKDIIPLILIVLIGVFSPIPLYFLIRKHRLAVLTYSILLILVITNFLGSVLWIVISEGKTKDGLPQSDYLLSLGIYLLIFGLWLIIVRKYRFKGMKTDLEIENIGKHED
ncbi:hypothetical protein [Chryseobacterium jejuense]|uniref:hypothetical protein n=1 Tax=Chryseobacterium jejuense TaxID=445960 RepID=UPI001AE885C5|nr:hypothetical protein [Chryseobacterium jejuense]MBP2616203.1 Co/Zn/Cd efflux system component [Chryseobacterium jejuense]